MSNTKIHQLRPSFYPFFQIFADDECSVSCQDIAICTFCVVCLCGCSCNVVGDAESTCCHGCHTHGAINSVCLVASQKKRMQVRSGWVELNLDCWVAHLVLLGILFVSFALHTCETMFTILRMGQCTCVLWIGRS